MVSIVLVATHTPGSLFLFDPLRSNLGEPLYKSTSRIVSLRFDEKARNIVLVNTAGEVILIHVNFQKHWQILSSCLIGCE
jgi:hypothetical protein